MTPDELVAFLRARWAEERQVATDASHPGFELPPSGHKEADEYWCWYYEDTDEPVPLQEESGELAHFCFDGEGKDGRRRARLRSLNWYAKRATQGRLRHMVVQAALVDVGAAVHIARHSPGRVLADIAAKERILTQYEGLRQRWEQGEAADDATVGAIDGLEEALRALAAAYAEPVASVAAYADKSLFWSRRSPREP
ncbi:DUF6221 family protein [Nonomuraea longicatena]|uniref:Immunity protein 35 domain-containing protein n=1 Tax=Nonomuraea longicatena TaxID=83682 RepID=A0ABP3ZAJ8_9ACTN